jgi:hypothetical protein
MEPIEPQQELTIEDRLSAVRIQFPNGVPEVLRAPRGSSIYVEPESHHEYFRPLLPESLDEVKSWIGVSAYESEPPLLEPFPFEVDDRLSNRELRTDDDNARLAEYARDYVWQRRRLPPNLITTLNDWFSTLVIHFYVLAAADVIVERESTLVISPQAPLLIANKVWIGRGGSIRFTDSLRINCATIEREFLVQP